MESTDHGQGDDLAPLGRFNRPRLGSILVQRPVRAVLMMIDKVVREPPSQVLLVEHDHVVQTFAADGADQAFDERVLPGRAWHNELLFQSEGKSPPNKFQTVNAIAIAEQIAGWNGVGKCHRDRGADSGVEWRREMPRPVAVRSRPPKANR